MPTNETFVKDVNSEVIHALRAGEVVNNDVDGTTDRSAIPANSRVIEIGASTDCWILFGDVTVDASNSTGMFFPKGISVYQVDPSQTYVAYIRDTADGRISITRLY